MDEFLSKASLSPDEGERWMKLGLLVPAARTTGKVPVFTEDQLATVETVRSLLALGYDEEGVAKIVRKVGLPGTGNRGVNPGGSLRTVGELAQECRVNPRTIKHWEDKGLLEPDARSEGGFRLYGPGVLERCRRIVDLQNLGYTLEEIRAAAGLLDTPEALIQAFRKDPRAETIALMERENAGLKERITLVMESAKRLEDLVKRRTKAIATCKALLDKSAKERREGATEACAAPAHGGVS